MRKTVLLLALLGMACEDAGEGRKAETTSPTDADGDGYDAGTDCDDADASAYPGAEEVCDGIDNDCDGEIDNDPTDGAVVWDDLDADGYGDPDTRMVTCSAPAGTATNGDDCDDSDDAVSPDAAELCNGADDNCNGLVDDDATDTNTYFLDADGDGFGDNTERTQSCDQPLGYVTDNTDCNDNIVRINPSVDEIACDGRDNNCDGDTDENVVGRDFATIAEAAAALPDGSEICLDSGTYTEKLDLTGRSLSITGANGPRQTTLDIGNDTPMITLGVYDDDAEMVTSAYSSLTLNDVTITGLDLDTAGTTLRGGFLYVAGADVRLRGVTVDGFAPIVSDNSDLYGALAYVVDGGLDARATTLADNTFTFGGTSDGLDIDGGLIHGAGTSDIVLDDTTVTGFEVLTTDTPQRCDVNGGLVYTTSDANLHIDGLDISDSGATVDCADSYLDGLFIEAGGGESMLTDVTVAGNAVTLNTTSSGYSYALLYARDSSSHTWSNIDVSNNTIAVQAEEGSSYSYGALRGGGEASTFDHITAYNNTLAALAGTSSTSGYTYGTVHITGGTWTHLDVRNNGVTAHNTGRSAGVSVATFGTEATLRNVISAGNTLDGSAADAAYGGGLAVQTRNSDITIENADLFGNEVEGSALASGGGLWIYSDRESDTSEVTVTNVNVVGNTATADVVEGTGVAILLADGATLAWTYTNVFGHSGDAFFGVTDPAGTDGNLAVDPDYFRVNGTNPTSWNLTLKEGSPVQDAGDPAILDADDSVSDIGAYGGPLGDSW